MTMLTFTSFGLQVLYVIIIVVVLLPLLIYYILPFGTSACVSLGIILFTLIADLVSLSASKHILCVVNRDYPALFRISTVSLPDGQLS